MFVEQYVPINSTLRDTCKYLLYVGIKFPSNRPKVGKSSSSKKNNEATRASMELCNLL